MSSSTSEVWVGRVAALRHAIRGPKRFAAATVESRACIGHFLQDAWPPHEMFHLLMGLSGLLATYVMILILVWIPLRSGQRCRDRRRPGAYMVVDATPTVLTCAKATSPRS